MLVDNDPGCGEFDVVSFVRTKLPPCDTRQIKCEAHRPCMKVWGSTLEGNADRLDEQPERLGCAQLNLSSYINFAK